MTDYLSLLLNYGYTHLSRVDWFNLAVGIDPTLQLSSLSLWNTGRLCKAENNVALHGMSTYIKCMYDCFLYFYGSILMPISCDSNAHV